MSTRVVLGVAGAGIGFAIGGPQGAAWGWSIGSAVGSIVDPQVIKGPSIGDLAQQTSQEGVPIPIVFGLSQPISGNIIAAPPARIVKKKKGGKGGPKVETETVYRTYAIGVCEGPIGGFLRVWRNNVKVFDLTDPEFMSSSSRNITIPFGGGKITETIPSRNQAFLEKARFFTGTYDQLPSPDLEAIYGVGMTAAHQGLAYMVIVDEDVTRDGGMIPAYTFQVRSTGSVLSNGVLHPWLDQHYPMNPLNTHLYDLTQQTSTGWTSSSSDIPQLSIGDYRTDMGSLEEAISYLNSKSGSYPVTDYYGYAADPVTYSGDGATYLRLYNAADMPCPTAAESDGPDVRLVYGRHPVDVILTAQGLAVAMGAVNYFTVGPYLQGYIDFDQRAFINGFDLSNRLNRGRIMRRTDSTSGPSIPPESGVLSSGGDGWPGYGAAFIVVRRTPGPPVAGAELVSGTFKVLQTFSDSPLRKPLNPCLRDDDVNYSSQAYWEAAYAAAVAAGTMTAGKTYSASGADDPSTTYPVTQSWAYIYSGGTISESRVYLRDVCEAICERVGVTGAALDVSLLPAVDMGGLTITNQYPAFSAIKSLGDIYLFDIAKYDSKIRFIPRGGNAVATITEDDMVFDEQGDDDRRRADPIPIPRSLHLNYFDVDGSGLSTAKQTSERFGDRRAVGERSAQTSVLIDADLAAKTVVVMHKTMIEEQKGELKIKLPDNWLSLTPADPIVVQQAGRSERFRIQREMIYDGFQHYTLLRDRQSNYTADVEGIPPIVVPAPPSQVVGPTIIAVMDIPLLRDSDDTLGLGYYLAVGSVSDGWRGATVEMSTDGGANYTESRDATVPTVMGWLATALPSHPRDYPDETSSFQVTLYDLGDELDVSDFDDLLNGANLAAVGNQTDGWELINFAGATLVDEASNTWEIAGPLLRGRKYTQPSDHAAEDTLFVLLTRGTIEFVPANYGDLGRTLTFRATSSGQTTDTGLVVSLPDFTGRTQIEYPVGYLSADFDDDDVVVTWQGAPRLGSGISVLHGAEFVGYRVVIDDKLNEPIEIDTLQETVQQDVSGLLTPMEIRVAAVNRLTGLGPWAVIGWPIMKLTYAYDAVGRPGTDDAYQNPMIIGDRMYVTTGRYSTLDPSDTARVEVFSADGKTYIDGYSIGAGTIIWGATSLGGYIFLAYQVIFGTSGLIKMDPADGSTVDEVNEAGVTNGVATDGSWIYFTTDANVLYRYDPTTMTQDGTPIPFTDGLSEISYADGKIFVLYTEALPTRRMVGVVDVATFTLLDSFEVPFADASKLIATERCVFVRTGNTGQSLMVYTHDGQLLRQYSTGVYPDGVGASAQFATDGDFVCCIVDQKIKFFDARTGEHVEGQDVEMTGPIGGYANGHYILFNGPDASAGRFYKQEVTTP